MGGISTTGIDLHQLTNGRYDPWVTLLNNTEWLGEESDYINFTELLHVHNIFLETLARYGVFTAVLFTVFLVGVLMIFFMSTKTFNIGLYIFAFLLLGMFEYNYLFMFVYFSPVILFFVIVIYLIDVVNGGRNN